LAADGSGAALPARFGPLVVAGLGFAERDEGGADSAGASVVAIVATGALAESGEGGSGSAGASAGFGVALTVTIARLGPPGAAFGFADWVAKRGTATIATLRTPAAAP
jgi:hypothetical protein